MYAIRSYYDYLKAVHHGHAAIEEEQSVRLARVRCAPQLGKRIVAVGHVCDLCVPGRQGFRKNTPVGLVIIHDERPNVLKVDR